MWCLFELWKTVNIKKDSSRLKILTKDLFRGTIDEVFKTFAFEKSTTVIERDRANILKNIKASIGVYDITAQIKQIVLESSLADVEAASLSEESTIDMQHQILPMTNASYL